MCISYFLKTLKLSLRISGIIHNATHCNTLQHTATHCITAKHSNTQQRSNTLHHTASYRTTLHHSAPVCSDSASIWVSICCGLSTNCPLRVRRTTEIVRDGESDSEDTASVLACVRVASEIERAPIIAKDRKNESASKREQKRESERQQQIEFQRDWLMLLLFLHKK